jgi:hypothetical protein
MIDGGPLAVRPAPKADSITAQNLPTLGRKSCRQRAAGSA